MNNYINPMAFRYINYIVAVLLGLSAIAQINDPDPLFWVLIYAGGALVSILYAFNKLHWITAVLLAIIAGIWAITIIPDLTATGFKNIFEEIGMQYVGVEAAREFSGLIIIALWSLVLAVKSKEDKTEH